MEYQGELTGFPTEVVEKMLENQVAQGNPKNIGIFENKLNAHSGEGGFTWINTSEGNDFWHDVIGNKKFDYFFTKYPKTSPYPKVMLVSDCDNIKGASPRVVFMEKKGKYLAWSSAETLEEAEYKFDINTWKYAWDIPKEEPVVEVTIDQATEIIAKAKNIDPKRLRIKK